MNIKKMIDEALQRSIVVEGELLLNEPQNLLPYVTVVRGELMDKYWVGDENQRISASNMHEISVPSDERIRAVIQALADYDECIHVLYDDIDCQYCGGPEVSTGGAPSFQHKEDCPVAQARALLKEIDKGN